MILISVIVWLIVLGIIWYLVDTYLPLPAPIKLVIRVLFVLLAILILLSLFGLVSLPVPQLRI